MRVSLGRTRSFAHGSAKGGLLFGFQRGSAPNFSSGIGARYYDTVGLKIAASKEA
jgi:hypothetical protein